MQLASKPAAVLTVIFLAACLIVALNSPIAPALAQSGSGAPGNGNLQMISSPLPSGMQQIVILDANERSLAVYQIEPNQGKISLKSVRRLTQDLSMEEFNAQSPTPSELRKINP